MSEALNTKRLASAERTGKKDKTDKKFSFRNNFEKLLGKLNENATMESGFKELQNIIRNNTSSDNLRVYMNSLSSCINISTLNAKERIVLLFGFVASIYKENLIDPLEKDLISTIKKIIEVIKHFMKENSFGIHLACSNTFIELYNSFSLSKNEEKEQQIIQTFCEPLIQIINTGASKYAQSAAVICLSELCKHLTEEKTILEEIYQKIIVIILKKKSISEYSYLFNCLSSLINHLDFELIQGDLPQLLFKLEDNVNSNNLTKIEVCRCLEVIGEKLLKQSEETIIKYYSIEIVNSLQSLSKDRTANVVLIANKSLKVWLELKRVIEENENKSKLANTRNEENVKKSKSLTKLNFVRDFSKLNKCSTPEMAREEIYSKGITNLLRTSDFLKKNNKTKHFQTSSKFFVKKDKITSSLEQFKLGIGKKLESSLLKNSHISFIDSNEKQSFMNKSNKEEIETSGKKNFLKLLGINALEKFDSMCASFINHINEKLTHANKKLNKLEEKLNDFISKNESIDDKKIRIVENFHQKVPHMTKKNIGFRIEKLTNMDLFSSTDKTQRETEFLQSDVVINTIGKNDSDLNKLWNDTLHSLKTNNINLAYSRLLNANDDLYLLRLVFLTGPVMNILNIDNSKKLLHRMNLISRSHQIESLIYNIIEQSYELNIFLYLEEEFQNSLLDTLYEYSLLEETDIGKKSENLYSMITANTVKG